MSDQMNLQSGNGKPIAVAVFYRNGDFAVNACPDADGYDVTHVGSGLPALRFLPKEKAISLCNEIVATGIAGQTQLELINSPQWGDTILIVRRYLPWSKKKPKRGRQK